MKYPPPRVDNHGIQWRGVCNNSFIICLNRISGGKNYDEEGKEMEEERKRKKCSWLDLNSAPLFAIVASQPLSEASQVVLSGLNHLASYSEASQVVLSGVATSTLASCQDVQFTDARAA